MPGLRAPSTRDPADRRFHAQTVACPDCGPTLDAAAARVSRRRSATTPIARGAALLAAGGILAVKGIGGYHLACDAGNASAVSTLRKRKDRGDKPFAIMVADLGHGALRS